MLSNICDNKELHHQTTQTPHSIDARSARLCKSFTTNLLETVDYLTYSMSRKMPVGLVCLDFAKAFDKVSRELTLLKLEA